MIAVQKDAWDADGQLGLMSSRVGESAEDYDGAPVRGPTPMPIADNDDEFEATDEDSDEFRDALAAWWGTPGRDTEDPGQGVFDIADAVPPEEFPTAPDPLDEWWLATVPAEAPEEAVVAVEPPGPASAEPDLVKVWRWIGPAPVVAAGPLRRLTPEGWAPADYVALASTVRAAQFLPAENAFTSYAQIFAAFLAKQGG